MDNGPERTPADLGPISPELVLVDPVLAEQARKLLPDVVERPRPPAPAHVAEPAAPPAPAPMAVEPAPVAPRRRWRRMLVLAVLVFVAGAISGALLGGKDAAPVGVTLGALDEAPSTPPSSTGTQATRPQETSAQTTRPAKTSTRAALRPPSGRRQAPGEWASNVIGVEAQVDDSRVTLSWQPPERSGHVAVVRRHGARGHGDVVFDGRAASYRDSAVRPCTAYSYTIVNFDRRGHPSTGIPTSVVTAGCS